MKFVKGQSGNPAGRTPGSKNKKTAFATKFWEDLHDIWQSGGASALKDAIIKNPLGFCQMAASLLPKEETHEHKHIVAVRLWTREESQRYLTAQENNSRVTTIEHSDMPSLSAIEGPAKH